MSTLCISLNIVYYQNKGNSGIHEFLRLPLYVRFKVFIVSTLLFRIRYIWRSVCVCVLLVSKKYIHTLLLSLRQAYTLSLFSIYQTWQMYIYCIVTMYFVYVLINVFCSVLLKCQELLIQITICHSYVCVIFTFSILQTGYLLSIVS